MNRRHARPGRRQYIWHRAAISHGCRNVTCLRFQNRRGLSEVTGGNMAYVIAEPCIGTKDTACVDVCPVDCIHPRKDEANFADATQLYIDPAECIDCGACVPSAPSLPSSRSKIFLINGK